MKRLKEIDFITVIFIIFGLELICLISLLFTQYHENYEITKTGTVVSTRSIGRHHRPDIAGVLYDDGEYVVYRYNQMSELTKARMIENEIIMSLVRGERVEITYKNCDVVFPILRFKNRTENILVGVKKLGIDKEYIN